MIKLSKGNKNYYLTCENGQLIFTKNIKVRNKIDVKDGKKTAKIQAYKIKVGIDLLPDSNDLECYNKLLSDWRNKMIEEMNELKRLRDKLNLSNDQLADLLGLSKQTVQNRMGGGKKKTLSKLELEFLKLMAGESDKYAIIDKKIFDEIEKLK